MTPDWGHGPESEEGLLGLWEGAAVKSMGSTEIREAQAQQLSEV